MALSEEEEELLAELYTKMNMQNSEDFAYSFHFKNKDDFTKRFLPVFKKYPSKVMELLEYIIERGFPSYAKFFREHAEQKSFLNLKKNPEIFFKSYELMYNSKLEVNEHTKYCFSVLGTGFLRAIESGFATKYKNELAEIVVKVYDYIDHPYQDGVGTIAQKFNWQGQLSSLKSIVDKLIVIIKSDFVHIYKFHSLVSDTEVTFRYLDNAIGSNKNIASIGQSFGELFNLCVSKELIIDDGDNRLQGEDGLSERDRRTLAGEIVLESMKTFYKSNHSCVELLKPVVSSLQKLQDDCEIEEFEEAALELISLISDNADIFGGESADVVIEKYLESGNSRLLSSITAMYPDQKSKIYEHYDAILEMASDDSNHGTYDLVALLKKISVEDMQKIDNTAMDILINLLETNFGGNVCGVLHEIAEKRPELFKPYHNKLLSIVENHEMGKYYFHLLVILCKEINDTSKKFVKTIWKMFDAHSTYQLNAVAAFYSLSSRNKELLMPYKSRLEELKEDPNFNQYIEPTLDTLEGRSLEKVANDVEEQKEDIRELDTRVTTNENKIDDLDNEVQETKEDVANVKKDVEETKARVNEIEYTVKGLDERVEQLNHMTLSHAPAWSRHVSEVMNNQADNDWRLLAMKLNYSNDDIRNWATQPDPCLSLLDEWFATHKTKEATYAILNNLKEMNRLDAAEIVENALESVKDVVKVDEDEEFENPEIFLSYQWGHQQEVKMLKQHLEMAGYKSWMDIGQMGGGDKLYAKIDDGVRSAKVIISCVSEKYAKSANCCREVNLSTNLGKTMIPLLMEQLSWPPAGPMGPIMSEYLYIRFFKPDGMKKGDKVFWVTAKFQELLMQLRYHVVPNMKLIKKESQYFGWTNPPEEEIVIPIRKQKEIKSTSKSEKTNENEELSPDVFISYQWDKQSEIKLLYKKLSEQGYHCWLDIMQMGGGDSLFDKIDKGIRGAKVVLSCVTKKYALSANCRREVSLSGALSKPIIPLLMEQMTWPPEGPMSMVFTQLLYIGFHKKKGPDVWINDEFEQLKCKINSNVPEMQAELNSQIDEEKERLREEEAKAEAEKKRNEELKAVERKRQEELAEKKRQEDELAAKKRQNEELAEKKRQEQELVEAKKKQEEEIRQLRKREQELAEQKRKQEEEFAKQKRRLEKELDEQKRRQEQELHEQKRRFEQEAARQKEENEKSSTCILL